MMLGIKVGKFAQIVQTSEKIIDLVWILDEVV